MSKLGYAFGAIVFGLGVWMLVIWVTGAPSFILPTPWRVVHAAWDNRALIGAHTLITATEVILGLSIGTMLGAVTAIQLALSQRLYRVVMPLLIFTQAVPVFAIAPLLTLWLGYGIASKVLMAVLIIYFPVTSAFYDGLTRVARDITDMARTMNGTRWQIMRRITIPHALPSLGTGLKLAAVYAPIGAVIGEWVGASRGLGYLMLLANGRAKTDLMFAALLALVLMTLMVSVAVNMLAARLKWD